MSDDTDRLLEIERELGRALQPSELVVVDSLCDLSLEQREIVKAIARNQTVTALQYLKRVVPRETSQDLLRFIYDGM